MPQNSFTDQLAHLFDQVKIYLNLRLDYLKINIAEYLIRFFSGLVLWMVMFWFIFFVLVFGSFAFAYWFGEMTGKMWLGFLIVMGFYLILAIAIFVARQALIVRPFTRMIMENLELDKFEEETNEKE
jgi:hypothetical protein